MGGVLWGHTRRIHNLAVERFGRGRQVPVAEMGGKIRVNQVNLQWGGRGNISY